MTTPAVFDLIAFKKQHIDCCKPAFIRNILDYLETYEPKNDYPYKLTDEPANKVISSFIASNNSASNNSASNNPVSVLRSVEGASKFIEIFLDETKSLVKFAGESTEVYDIRSADKTTYIHACVSANAFVGFLINGLCEAIKSLFTERITERITNPEDLAQLVYRTVYQIGFDGLDDIDTNDHEAIGIFRDKLDTAISEVLDDALPTPTPVRVKEINVDYFENVCYMLYGICTEAAFHVYGTDAGFLVRAYEAMANASKAIIVNYIAKFAFGAYGLYELQIETQTPIDIRGVVLKAFESVPTNNTRFIEDAVYKAVKKAFEIAELLAKILRKQKD